MKTKLKLTLSFLLVFLLSIQISCKSESSDNPAAPDTKPKVSAPTFNPVTNTEFVGSQEITIACTTDGAVIRYTTDGTTPTDTVGTIYTAAFTVTVNTTVKAVAYKAEMTTSDVAAANYTKAGCTANPVISPGDGSSFSGSQIVTITSVTTGAAIRYTTDGTTTPTPTVGTVYTTAFTISATTVIKAIAYKSGLGDSSVVSAAITKIPCITPVISPGSGIFRIYNTEKNITITTLTTGATIKYTLDNSDPKTSPTAITGTAGLSAVTLNIFGTKTIKAYAYKADSADSDTAACEYVIARVSLPKTGQTVVYHAGDDGSLQRGVSWPGTRFTDNGNGTITDNLTGLMWEKAPIAASVTWANAVTRITALNTAALGGYTDWRLPNRNELKSLVNYEQPDLKTWLQGQGFINIQLYKYFSSSMNVSSGSDQWSLGNNYSINMSVGTNSVLAVRGSGGGAVSLPRTGQTKCYQSVSPFSEISCSGTGQDGEYQNGVPWPSPRFTNNGNGTITDNLTGLMWERVQCLTSFTWANAFTRIAALNSSALGGYTDWRLPNVNELETLVNISQGYPMQWLIAQGFSSDWGENICWSASTYAYDTNYAWMVSMCNFAGQGDVVTRPKNDESYVLAVRSGQ